MDTERPKRIDLNAVMFAGLRNDTEALRAAVPGLVAYIREVEAERDMWHDRYLAECNSASDFRKEILDVTEEVMKTFPGSKLQSSIERNG